ncbi:hypothetical protein [Acidiplasma cupricumulans]|uniref:hypothetical protein n=1 Tax=Acidiplasma cupricumulans TaxID=312540 RepID=UPI000B2A7C6D|nr:hypothetical protein [Acidiplasma cupricumulans]
MVNSSSISIRSSIIDRDTLDYFVNLPGDMDEFLFYELLHSGLDLLMTKDILSFYSIHKEGNSKPKTPSEMVKYIGRIKKSLEMLNKLLENTEFFQYGQMKLKYWIYKEQLIDEKSHVSVKFLLITFVDVIKFRADYYLCLAFFLYISLFSENLP